MSNVIRKKELTGVLFLMSSVFSRFVALYNISSFLDFSRSYTNDELNRYKSRHGAIINVFNAPFEDL